MTHANIIANWSGGNLSFVEAVLGNGAVLSFGQNDDGLDVKWFGNTSGAFMLWDESADALVLDKADIVLGDADMIVFGDGDDVTITWDGTNLLLAAAADDSLIEIGDAAATQKSFDVKIYGNAANGADYLLWDASASALLTVGAAILMGSVDDANGISWVLPTKTTAGAPGTTGTTAGAVVFNTNDNKLYVYNGSAWKTVTLS